MCCLTLPEPEQWPGRQHICGPATRPGKQDDLMLEIARVRSQRRVAGGPGTGRRTGVHGRDHQPGQPELRSTSAVKPIANRQNNAAHHAPTARTAISGLLGSPRT
jgi:hypothetical protein